MVQLSCGVQCTRILLFLLNILFLLMGLTVMGFGIYIKADGYFIAVSDVFEHDGIEWIGVGMITTGVFTVCLATFGCLGAVFKNRCLLYLYSIILILIILVEFIAVVMVVVFRNRLWKTSESSFIEIFHHAYSQNKTNVIKGIENFERQYKCCGIDGAFDYTKFGYKIPLSCYPNQSPTGFPYSRGCLETLTIWIWNELPIIIGGLIGILLIEIFCLISSLVLGVAVSHSLNAENYQKF